MADLVGKIKKAHDLIEKGKNTKAKEILERISADSSLGQKARLIIENASKANLSNEAVRATTLLQLTIAQRSQAVEETSRNALQQLQNAINSNKK